MKATKTVTSIATLIMVAALVAPAFAQEPTQPNLLLQSGRRSRFRSIRSRGMTFGTARRHPALTNSETPFGSTSVWAIRDVFPVRTGSARGASAGDLADGRASLALAEAHRRSVSARACSICAMRPRPRGSRGVRSANSRA